MKGKAMKNIMLIIIALLAASAHAQTIPNVGDRIRDSVTAAGFNAARNKLTTDTLRAKSQIQIGDGDYLTVEKNGSTWDFGSAEISARTVRAVDGIFDNLIVSDTITGLRDSVITILGEYGIYGGGGGASDSINTDALVVNGPSYLGTVTLSGDNGQNLSAGEGSWNFALDSEIALSFRGDGSWEAFSPWTMTNVDLDTVIIRNADSINTRALVVDGSGTIKLGNKTYSDTGIVSSGVGSPYSINPGTGGTTYISNDVGQALKSDSINTRALRVNGTAQADTLKVGTGLVGSFFADLRASLVPNENGYALDVWLDSVKTNVPFTAPTVAANSINTGALTVTGAATLQSTLAVTGNVAVNTNKFTVTAATGKVVSQDTIVGAGLRSVGALDVGETFIRGDAWVIGPREGIAKYTAQSGSSTRWNSIVPRGQNGAPLYVRVGEGGAIETSSDALTWTSRTSGTTSNLNSVVYKGAGANQGFWVVGTNIRLYSADGITWETKSTTGGNVITFSTSSPDRGFIGGFSYFVYITTDGGSTWTTVTQGDSQGSRAAAFVGSNLYYVTRNLEGNTFTRVRRIDWSNPSTIVTVSPNLYPFMDRQMIVLASGRVVISGDGGAIYYSDPPNTSGSWVSVTISGAGSLRLMEANGRVYAFGENGEMYVSDDGGATWVPGPSTGVSTFLRFGAPDPYNPTRALVVGDGGVMLIGEYPRSTLYAGPISSSDVVTATRFQSGTGTSVFDTVTADSINTRALVVDGSGTIKLGLTTYSDTGIVHSGVGSPYSINPGTGGTVYISANPGNGQALVSDSINTRALVVTENVRIGSVVRNDEENVLGLGPGLMPSSPDPNAVYLASNISTGSGSALHIQQSAAPTPDNTPLTQSHTLVIVVNGSYYRIPLTEFTPP